MSADHLFDHGLHTVLDEDEENEYDNIVASKYDFQFNPLESSSTGASSLSWPNSDNYLTTSTLRSSCDHTYEFATTSTTAYKGISIYSDLEITSCPGSRQQTLVPKPCD